MINDDANFNIERRRYYGLRKGDLVTYFPMLGIHEVKEYGFMDNNCVLIAPIEGGFHQPVIAEHCKIHTKVEERK